MDLETLESKLGITIRSLPVPVMSTYLLYSAFKSAATDTSYLSTLTTTLKPFFCGSSLIIFPLVGVYFALHAYNSKHL
ncbi:hypothetical protein DRN75_02555 [Nanoarchaeota archaeon]|nr:MAG: hypothetical protein DRN75_02555 [Nanoarchaeota archaeon]